MSSATCTAIFTSSRREPRTQGAADVPPRRLLVRTVWLALPVSVALLVLALFGHLAPRAALLAWLLGLILSGVLAWLRERRLEATGEWSGARGTRLPDLDGPAGPRRQS